MNAPLRRATVLLPADRAYRALLHALRPHLGQHCLLGSHSRDWASATFIGARHLLTAALEGADAMPRAIGLRAMLGDTELPISGGFVADIEAVVIVKDAQVTMRIEALTIEEGCDAGTR